MPSGGRGDSARGDHRRRPGRPDGGPRARERRYERHRRAGGHPDGRWTRAVDRLQRQPHRHRRPPVLLEIGLGDGLVAADAATRGGCRGCRGAAARLSGHAPASGRGACGHEVRPARDARAPQAFPDLLRWKILRLPAEGGPRHRAQARAVAMRGVRRQLRLGEGFPAPAGGQPGGFFHQSLRPPPLQAVFQGLHGKGVGHLVGRDQRAMGRAAREEPLDRQSAAPCHPQAVPARRQRAGSRGANVAHRALPVPEIWAGPDVGGHGRTVARARSPAGARSESPSHRAPRRARARRACAAAGRPRAALRGGRGHLQHAGQGPGARARARCAPPAPGAPARVREIAAGLEYRDFVIVGALYRRLMPNAAGRGPLNLVPDNWIYVQEPRGKVGRLQIFNNWSPYLVSDPNTVWIGMEYFCSEGDELWKESDDELMRLGRHEMHKLRLADPADHLYGVVVRMPKAYPGYFGTYEFFGEIRRYLDAFPNLYLAGRNGMHRYNNQDHSMLSAKRAAEAILAGSSDKTPIWNVNIDDEHHEEKQGG